MAFSAGTVVLEVWPSFRNVQRQMASEGREAGREFGRGLERELDRTDRSATKAGAKAGGAFTRAMKLAIEKVPAEVAVDATKARRELWKLREEAKVILEGFESGELNINTAAALAQIRAFKARADALAKDDIEFDVRTDAGALKQALSDLVDFHHKAVGETKAEARERVAAERAARKAESDMLRDAYRENADYTARRAVQARKRADAEKQAIREENDALRGERLLLDRHNAQVVQSYRNRTDTLRQLARAAAVEQRDAEDEAVRTRADADIARAMAAQKARYEAESRYAEAAARSKAASAIKAAATERITAELVEHAVKQSYDEQSDASTRARLIRQANARLAERVERNSAGGGLIRQAWAQNIGQAANSFRLFNGALLTTLALGPLLIPVLAAIAAGMGGIAIAIVGVLGGIGALVAGLSGIGGAVSAMNALDSEKKFGTGSGSRASQAPTLADRRRLRDAELDLARAREDAGQRIRDSLERQEDAERRLADAQKDAQRAQADLTQARKEAAEELERMRGDLTKGLVDERAAELDVKQAEAHYAVLAADPQATAYEKEVARLAADKAKSELDGLRRENTSLRKQIADIERGGIDSTEKVIDAKRRLNDMNERVADSERDLDKARRNVSEARIDEARKLFDVQQRYKDALEDMKPKIDEGAAATGSMATAVSNLREAMDNLSPAGQRFAEFLYGLKPFLDSLRGAAQEGLLPGLQSAISTIMDKYGDRFITFIGTMAQVVGEVAELFAREITSPWWDDFFETMAEVSPGILRSVADIVAALSQAFAGVLLAFAPYAQKIADVVVDLADAFAQWGASLSDSDGFKTFMDYVRDAGPKVGKLLGLLGEVLVNLAIGLAPYADKLLDFLIGFVGWLAGMNPDTIAKVALGLGAFVVVIQTLAGLMAAASSIIGLVAGIAALFGPEGALAGIGAAVAAAGPVGLAIAAIVAAVVGLGIAFKWAFDNVEWFHDGVVNIIETLGGYFEGFYSRVSEVLGLVGGVFREVGDKIMDVLNPVVVFFRTIIGPTISWFYESIVAPVFNLIGGAVEVLWGIFSKLADIIYQLIVHVIAPVISDLYYKYINPIWEKYIKPVFQALGNFIAEKVAPAFQAGRDAIGRIWSGLMDLAKKPIEFVVNTVINRGIIDNFNKLVSIFPGIDPVDHVQLPSSWNNEPRTSGGGGGAGVQVRAFARGGMMPGYTPGRDVHTFFSPTAGILELSGGEPVLRPEVGRVLGRDWVDGVNAAARSGGTRGVQAYLGGFASGGWIGNLLGGAKNLVGGIGDAIGNAVGSVRELAAAPARVLRKVVEALVGSNPPGLYGLGAGFAYKIIDGIEALISGTRENHTASGGIGWKAMSGIIAEAFPDARVSDALRPSGTMSAAGTVSYHGLGRAIDIVPPSMALFDWLSKTYPDSSELLYTPAGSNQILRRGVRGSTSGETAAMHYNHVHWALANGGVVPNLYDDGGALPPGISLVANRTGKPEQVLTGAQWNEIKRGGDVTHYYEIGHMGADAHDVALELERVRRERLAVEGLNAAELVG